MKQNEIDVELLNEQMYTQKAYRIEKGVSLDGIIDCIENRKYWDKKSKWELYTGEIETGFMGRVSMSSGKKWKKQNNTTGSMDIVCVHENDKHKEVKAGEVRVTIKDNVAIVKSINYLIYDPVVLTSMMHTFTYLQKDEASIYKKYVPKWEKYFYRDLFVDLDAYVEKCHEEYAANSCPHCGEMITGKGKFCANCGSPLQ